MALLHPNFLKSLVAIGDRSRNEFNCKATGFLIGFIVRNSKDPEKRKYRVFLATNRHVFEGREFVDLRFNKKNGKSKVFRQSLRFSNQEPRWLAHRYKKVDLALLMISTQILEANDIDYFFINEEFCAYFKDFKKIGISIGDDIYILGYPLGLAGKVQNYACIKSGIIARFDKELVRENKAYLIDASVFPGNSGGPVILKPVIASIDGTKAVAKPYLLGIISSSIPYEEELYTHQTIPPSVVSLERENSGLAFVVTTDFLSQIFKSWIKKKKDIEKAQKQVVLAHEIAHWATQ